MSLFRLLSGHQAVQVISVRAMELLDRQPLRGGQIGEGRERVLPDAPVLGEIIEAKSVLLDEADRRQKAARMKVGWPDLGRKLVPPSSDRQNITFIT